MEIIPTKPIAQISNEHYKADAYFPRLNLSHCARLIWMLVDVESR